LRNSVRLELGASASLMLRKSRFVSLILYCRGTRLPIPTAPFRIWDRHCGIASRQECLLTWRIPLGDVVASELRRSEASERVYKKENEMLYGKDEKSKDLGLTKRSQSWNEVAALRPVSITWKRSLTHIVFQKELQMVLYYLHICVIPFFVFPGTYRYISRETDAVKFAYTRFVIKLGSNAVSNANSFHYASSPFISVRPIVHPPLIGSRLASPLRFLPAAANRHPQWTCKAPTCYHHPFSPSPLYHLPFAESVASAGLLRAGLALQEH
jgi:hypothetical protein